MEVKTAGDVTDLINRRADQGDMISVSVSDTLLTAYKRMRASDISQIPVLDGERLVGVLDEEDLLFNVSKSKAAFTQSVVDFMVTDLDVLPVGASEEELLDTLTQGKVAIIYQGDTFVGFITKVDLINHYRTKISED